MMLFEVLPAVAAAGMVVASVSVAVMPEKRRPHLWLVPAALSALFLVWSIFTIVVEGPTGFWANHTVNAWGNQVWFDLLLAIGTAYALLVPDARRVGMRPLPWLGLILCTGCIGLLAMVSRYQFLKQKKEPS